MPIGKEGLFLFKPIYQDVYNYMKSKASKFVTLKGFDVEKSYLQASNVENVKTIWQVDKSVNLNDFYYPSKLACDEKEFELDSLSKLPENGKIVIEGTAGQGKSILARYLSGKALRTGICIPIFVELRKITSRKSLPQLIVSSINNMDIPVGEEDLGLVFSSNKFSLILDAFDEIPESEVQPTLAYLEDICMTYYEQQIIITSRPDSEIQKVPLFNVYNLAQLDTSDFKPLLSKLFEDAATVNLILKSIHENITNIGEVLKTPLLITLLAITYKGFNEIPTQLHEFYENLFHLLVNRHDSTKPGFKREFLSDLNEKKLEKLFCAFCFYSMILGKTSLSRVQAIEQVEKASHLTKIDLNSEIDFLTDCIKNTCLVIKEGFDYHFIHKSIREFHAASFISVSPLNLKEKFYFEALINYSRFTQELIFLSVLDEFYFKKLYLYPLFKNRLADIGYFNSEFDYTKSNILRSLSFMVGNNSTTNNSNKSELDESEVDVKQQVTQYSWGGSSKALAYFTIESTSSLYNKVMELIMSKEFVNYDESIDYSATDYIKDNNMEDEVNVLIERAIDADVHTYNLLKREIDEKEKEMESIQF